MFNEILKSVGIVKDNNIIEVSEEVKYYNHINNAVHDFENLR